MLLVKVGHFHLSSLLVSIIFFFFVHRVCLKLHTSCLSCGILKPQGVSHIMQPLLLNLLCQGAQWMDLRGSSQIRIFFFPTHLQNDNSAACLIKKRKTT